MITVKIFPCNPFRELCYVVSDESGEAIIVDCGTCDESERGRIEVYIAGNGIPFAIDARESGVLASAPASAAMFGLPVEDDIVPSVDMDLSKESEIRFGDTVLQVLYTPGHTPGGVSLYHSESKTLFTGDTLFAGSIGRTDLPGGDYDTLMDSIIKRILPLGGDVKIYPGHGNSSTLAHEAAYNPFVAEVLQGTVDTPERI